MSIVSAVVDDREPIHIQQMLFGSIRPEVSRIDTDVLILTDTGDVLAFERKESNDLLNTLRSDRLFPQLETMLRLTPLCYLVICGTLQPGQNGKAITDRVETGWAWPAVAGALLTCQEIGVHVVQCHSLDFAGTVERIANRDRRSVRVKPARDVSVMSDSEAFLTGLPGIGPDRAEVLMRYCGSAAAALHFLTDDKSTERIPGFGQEIKKRVRQTLGLDPRAVLAAVEREGSPRLEVGHVA